MDLKFVIPGFLRGFFYPYRNTQINICKNKDNKDLKLISLAFKSDLNNEANHNETRHSLLEIKDELRKIDPSIFKQEEFAIQIQGITYVVQNLPLSEKCELDTRVSQKIALVTGAAQGFGLGIAESLIKKGCIVFIADINKEKADECAGELCKTYNAKVAYSVFMDCAKEESVRQGIEFVVEQVGGIDILISNAGVVFSGDLEHLSFDAFRKTTDINYVGYFLLVKYFSQIMKYQFYGNENYFSDIIQINSKSGLTGSTKNSAYAGSKFGGVGLTQSFALELIEYNIKVNAICPGNFYDGPLWSDPEKGLFRQYLDAGKVAGAKSIEDVKNAYLAKAPIKRGCTVDDVMRGLLYLIEQKYETGQSLPITGGQIMLH